MPRQAEKIALLFKGQIRSDDFGRVVVDSCPSDKEHLISSVTNMETNKPTCRSLVEELFKTFLGREGVMAVEVTFLENPPAEDLQPFVDSLGG
jgi:hypothetical protein